MNNNIRYINPEGLLKNPAFSQVVITQGSGSGKLNPAHGQPGHDCAVAVGAPLKN
jgi:hypothetical protein